MVKILSQCLLLASLVLGTEGFVSPQIWSRIHSALRLYGNNQPEVSRIGAMGSPLWLGRMGFGERMTRLRATASFGGFGDEELSYAELREQLGLLESQLAGAMEYGRYDEAKQLVSEITTLKDFMDKQSKANGLGSNPFADAFGLAAATPQAPSRGGLDLGTPKGVRSRTGLGAAFGTGVMGGARRRSASKPGGLGNRDMWPQGKASKSGDMPIEAVRKRHSDITAYGIRVEVFCFFQPGASRPQDNLYQFQCNIRITNTNPGDVQLLSRELKIFKADGSPPEYGPASQQLESQPIVGPGSVYMYMSEFGITCVPEDKKYLGRIEGHFNVAVKDENAVVKVPIAPFWLEIPGDTLVLA